MAQERRLRRASLHRVDTRVPDDLYRRRHGLQDQGSRGARCGGVGARQGGRESHQYSFAIANSQALCRCVSLPKDVTSHGHAQRRDQEDLAG